MAISYTSAIRARLSHYLADDVSLGDLRVWLLLQLPAITASGDSEAKRLSAAILTRVFACEDDVISEDELVADLADELRSVRVPASNRSGFVVDAEGAGVLDRRDATLGWDRSWVVTGAEGLTIVAAPASMAG